MQPTLLPPGGTLIRGLGATLGLVGDIAKQVSANATIEMGGELAGNIGPQGIQMAADPPPRLRCFQIRSCWRRHNPPTNAGATRGLFWVCDATPVYYWWGNAVAEASSAPGSSCPPDDVVGGSDAPCSPVTPDASSSGPPGSSAGALGVQNSQWKSYNETTERIFYAVQAPDEAPVWQRVLYPSHGIGQWVWCVFDDEADVWRVLHAFDNLVRFRLIEPMVQCGRARADALGYGCERCRPTGPECGELVFTSSDGSWSTSVQPCTCLDGFQKLGRIYVYDPMGILGTALSCTTGWAKWCADSQRFEVIGSAGGTSPIVECCLAEDHPGRGIVFSLYPGTWSSSQNKWGYGSLQAAYGIDWRHGVTYPDKGARGYFNPKPSDTYGTIYDCVSLDCTSPGECGAGSSSS